MARKKGLTFYEKEKKISKAMVREIFITIFFALVAILIAFVIVFSVGMKVSFVGFPWSPFYIMGRKF